MVYLRSGFTHARSGHGDANQWLHEEMTPFEKAIATQLVDCSAADFFSALNAHFLHGFVHSDSSAFLMIRPVGTGSTREMIVDPLCQFREESCNAWFVYLAAGNLPDLFSLAPYPLEFICYERFGELKIVRFQSISEKVKQWERKKNGSDRRKHSKQL